MIYFNFILMCSCILLSVISPCFGTKCSRRIFNNVQSDVNFVKAILKPLSGLIPYYNTTTVPNFGELIEQFQIGKANADVYLNITQLITKYGYPVEQHLVITEDKYKLTMFRIPKPGAPVVFLQHGVECSSDDWITPGPKTGLAYALSDAGYDVWLANSRGNKHSRDHVDLSPDCAEFWAFTWDEMGRYDIPASIDYILEKTGKSKVVYIGHSQGTTAFYVMASERPEYNEKIAFMVCLSAVVFVSHVRSPLIQITAPFIYDMEVLTGLIGVYEVAPRDVLIDEIMSTFCGSPELAEIFCEFGIFSMSGFNYPQLNTTILPVIFGHYPAGSATGQIIHFGQEILSGKFCRFDLGPKNMEVYGTIEPPDYPLEKVTCPMAIFYSNNDWLTSAPDIYKFLTKLPNVTEFYHVPCASFMHFDYLFAKDSDILVNKEILRVIKDYADF